VCVCVCAHACMHAEIHEATQYILQWLHHAVKVWGVYQEVSLWIGWLLFSWVGHFYVALECMYRKNNEDLQNEGVTYNLTFVVKSFLPHVPFVSPNMYNLTTECYYYIPMHPWCFKIFSHCVEMKFSHTLWSWFFQRLLRLPWIYFLLKYLLLWLVCLVTFWKIVNSWHMYDFLSIAVCYLCWGPQNEKLCKMSVKTSQLIS